MRRWPSDQKIIIRMTSSNECREQKGVDLSDYNIYLNQIWYSAQALHYKHDEMCQIYVT